MAEIEGFEDMQDKVIINWGDTAISWHQWISNSKPVVQIHPGLHYKQFTDYFDLILEYKELQEIVLNQYSDTQTGKLYVGAAYGENGIWGRWCEYVFTKRHGNNKLLAKLLEMDLNYAENFRFSILILLPRTVTPDEAIRKERLFKNKLGTNSFGLNNN